MRLIRRLSVHYACVIVAGLLSAVAIQAAAAEPETKIEPVVDTLHGVAITDPYRWLEDQQSPATRAWIEEQITFTMSFLPKFTAKEKIRDRLRELSGINQMSAPSIRGQRYFYYRRAADQELWTIWYRDGKDGEEKLILDPHTLSTDFRTNASLFDISEDGKLVAYYIREGGKDDEEVHFRNVETGIDLPDILPDKSHFDVSITLDNSGCYYPCRLDDGSGRIYYHPFGAPVEEDKVIFGEGYTPQQIVSAGLSEDRNWLLFYVSYGSSGSRTDIYFQHLPTNGPITPLVVGVEASFSADILGDKIYISTDHNAPNGKLMRTDVTRPAMENWEEIIPEGELPAQGVSFVGGKLFVSYLENVSSKVNIHDADGKLLGSLALPGLGSGGYMSGRWDSNDGFYSFASYNVPSSIYHYDVATGTSDVYFRPAVPFDGSQFEVKQVWFSSKDGTKVPMFLAHRRELTLDGNNPVYLTGYGGFTAVEKPAFGSTYAVWMEAGGVVAAPALRGGGEYGEEWHKAAMKEHKQHTFDDFIAAAEWLIENRYTNPAKIGISGGSNGGLLVGAVMTQRPDLFKAVLCWHPLLDMVRYHKLMMGPYWISEYGSADSASQFPYLKAYSPYHNVKSGVKYPSIMFITGDGDTRVDPMHARKMTALFQAVGGTDDSPVLLYYDAKSGHAGGNPKSKTIEDASVQLGYMMWQLGMAYGQPEG